MRLAIINARLAIRMPDGLSLPYERFSITVNPDRSRTLRALSISPDGGLVRDVNVHVTRDWVSLSGSSRLYIDGALQGTVAKYNDGEDITSIVWPGHGKPDQTVFPAPTGRFSLGFHPLADEAWKMAHITPETGYQQDLTTHTCSPRWNGKTIEHGQTVYSKVEYLGEEDVALGAETLLSRVYLWHTPFDRIMKVWVHGEHNILTRQEVLKAPNAGTVYQLSSLEYATM